MYNSVAFSIHSQCCKPKPWLSSRILSSVPQKLIFEGSVLWKYICEVKCIRSSWSCLPAKKTLSSSDGKFHCMSGHGVWFKCSDSKWVCQSWFNSSMQHGRLIWAWRKPECRSWALLLLFGLLSWCIKRPTRDFGLCKPLPWPQRQVLVHSWGERCFRRIGPINYL